MESIRGFFFGGSRLFLVISLRLSGWLGGMRNMNLGVFFFQKGGVRPNQTCCLKMFLAMTN